jgi:hypothetical protein
LAAKGPAKGWLQWLYLNDALDNKVIFFVNYKTIIKCLVQVSRKVCEREKCFRTVNDMKGIEKVRAIYCFSLLTKVTQEQMYCHFSM